MLPRPPLGSKVSGTPEAALSGQNGTQGEPEEKTPEGHPLRPVWQENAGKCCRSINSTENLVLDEHSQPCTKAHCRGPDAKLGKEGRKTRFSQIHWER